MCNAQCSESSRKAEPRIAQDSVHAQSVRVENGIPINQEAMHQAFLNQDDQTGLEMDDKGFGAEQIGNWGEGE